MDKPKVHIDVDSEGDDVAVVIFAKPPPRDLLCIICHDLFVEPVLTRCGHTYCQECILKEIGSRGQCPLDRTPLSFHDTSPNLLAKSLVDELEVHCTYGCTLGDDGWVADENGCPEIIKFGLRKAHQHACEYAPLRCPAGGDKCDPVPAIDIEEHLERECQYTHGSRQLPSVHKVDGLEVATYMIVWSLLIFALLQSEFLGSRLRDIHGPLSVLLAVPSSVLAVILLGEQFFSWHESGS